MTQEEPERVSIEQLLKLVDALSAEEQEQFAQEMKLRSLRRELVKAEESLGGGEGIPAEEVFR